MATRTENSLKNSRIAIVFYVVNLILTFVSRKVFIDHLGVDILGLNTTATNLLGFLNIAELGIGSAIAYTLYKPLSLNDRQAINDIVSVQGWLYRKVAYVVIGGAIILMCFFPLIFNKMTLPLWYAYASFGVLLVSAMLSYFINYRSIILSADQKEYKITLIYRVPTLVKILIQIFAVYYFENGYVWWLIIEFVFAFISSYILDVAIKREYPWLKTDVASGAQLQHKYSTIITKTKQLFFHKIAAFALMQTSPIIIYAYASLALVTVYTNYILITNGILVLMASLFCGISASIGNLIAENNKIRIISVFDELFTIRFFFLSVICFCFYVLSPSFITLWIGENFILDNISVILILLILFVNLSRSLVDSYISAYGLFQDIWAAIAEASINIGLSILLGYFYGLHGILGGVLISLLLIVCIWKPYFLFTKGIKWPIWWYIKLNIKQISIFALVWALSAFILSLLPNYSSESFKHFVLYAIEVISIFGILMFGALYITSNGMKKFISRFIKI